MAKATPERPPARDPEPARPPAPAPAPAPVAAPTSLPEAGAGAPLAPSVATPISASLGVDVSPVRVHSDAGAGSAAGKAGARAFTYGSHVFLGKGERPTDLPLMAHEVAHVVQQQGAPALQLFTSGGADRHEAEAERASAAVVIRRRFSVRERVSARVQRLPGISDVLDYFADKANVIPGFRLFTIVLGVNPINMRRVERSGANILRGLVEVIPGVGALVVQALDNHGVFERAGAWIEAQFRGLSMTGAAIRAEIDRFLDGLGVTDFLRPWRLWDRGKALVVNSIRIVVNFVGGLIGGIVRLIKDAILRPLAALAARTPAWNLLRAVLGRDPITGDPYPQTAENLIGGFMTLIGQQEVWNNIQRARAIPRAFAWFKGVLAGVLGFVRQIPQLFITALTELTIGDIVLLPRAFAKVGRVFGSFALSFFSWAGGQVLSLLQIIFEVVAPGAMPYVRKAAGAFRQIIRNPVGFIRNLVRAGAQGFRQFAANFLSHLRRSLIGWLTGTMAGAGIYVPQGLDLKEIVKFVLSVLGLTWANIRAKLVRVIPEPAVRVLETTVGFVVTLVREGPAAAWEQIKESLGNLRDMVMGQIMSYVRNTIVVAAITKLATSLNPAGAFIQAIIAIYNTVMFFVERLRQIAQVVASFIDSISAIAAGAVGAAASRVEQTMGGLLTLVISFLARFAGLGKVDDAVKGIVARIRAPIDRALDRVVAFIVNLARRAGGIIAQAGVPQDPATRLRLGLDRATSVVNALRGNVATAGVITPLLGAIRTRYGLKSIRPVEQNDEWWIEAEVNPKEKRKSRKRKREPAPPPRDPLRPGELAAPAGQRTILLGEGDFSFALSVVRQLSPEERAGIVATEIRSEEQLAAAYPPVPGRGRARRAGAVANIAELRRLGVQVVTGVDATNISATVGGGARTIALTFPFIGGPRDANFVKREVDLITGFLLSAAEALEPGGQIMLTTTQHWHKMWRSDQRAPATLYVADRRQFNRSLFPGYEHRETKQNRSAKVQVSVTLIYRHRFTERPG